MQLYLRTGTPAHARAHASTHTHARALRRRHCAQRPAPHRRPVEHVSLGGAPPGPEKAAHTRSNVVTRAMFHAPMLALNAFAPLNAYEPSHPRSARVYPYIHITRLPYAQLHLRTGTPAHARAHTSAHVCAYTRARAPAVPPRTTARAASTTRPSASRRSGAPPGPERRRIPRTSR